MQPSAGKRNVPVPKTRLPITEMFSDQQPLGLQRVKSCGQRIKLAFRVGPTLSRRYSNPMPEWHERKRTLCASKCVLSLFLCLYLPTLTQTHIPFCKNKYRSQDKKIRVRRTFTFYHTDAGLVCLKVPVMKCSILWDITPCK
jgi:hypothetical protein